MRRVPLAMLCLVLCSTSIADTYRCKTPDGRTQISDTPCSGGSKTTAVVGGDRSTPWQRQQAQEELQRQRDFIAGREAENAAVYQQRQLEYQRMEQEQVRQQRVQTAQDARDVNQRRVDEQTACIERVNRQRLSTVQARKQLAVCGVDTPMPEPTQASTTHSAPAPTPTSISDQGNGTMRDNLGGTYQKNGNFLYGKDGSTCLNLGGVYSCN